LQNPEAQNFLMWENNFLKQNKPAQSYAESHEIAVFKVHHDQPRSVPKGLLDVVAEVHH